MSRMALFLVAVLFSLQAAASEYNQFRLNSRNPIDREILVAQILESYQYISGQILISWQRNDMDELAKALKENLLRAGVVPGDIRLQKESKYSDKATETLIAVNIVSARQPYSCDYQYQFYSYKETDKFGCALENNLHASLIDNNKVVF